MEEKTNATIHAISIGHFAAQIARILQHLPRALRYTGTAMSIAASFVCSLLYAHLLMIVYMHENNFFSYDYIARAGFASELMYLQFEIIALLLALGVAGFFPLLTHTYFRWRRWRKATDPSVDEKRSISSQLTFGIFVLIANIGTISYILLRGWTSPFLYATLAFASLVAVLVTIIYCVDVRIPRWTRLIGSFVFLGITTVLFPDIAAKFVGEALQRAKLGGNLLITMDYAEPRSVSRQQLQDARVELFAKTGRRAEPLPADSDDVLLSGARAFECVADAQGYLVLDAPEHLYVQVIADPCDASNSIAPNKKALFVQVIEKSRLRHYRLYQTALN